MPSQFKNPTHVARIGYNGFDMSHTLKFSSTVGELLPVYYDILQPGDKVSLKTVLRTRTMPIESAAMCKLYEHLEWFYVPITQIYQFFDAFYYGIQDVKTSLLAPSYDVSKYLPYFAADSFSELVKDKSLAGDAYFGTTSGSVQRLRGTSYRLLELLGIPIPDFRYQDQPTKQYPIGVCPLFLCAYQKIFSDYYRDADRESNNPASYNLDAYRTTGVIEYSGVPIYSPMFTLRYRRWRPDYMVHGYVSPLFGESSIGALPSSPVRPDLTKSFAQWLVPTNFITRNVGVWTASTNNTSNPNGRLEYVPDPSLPTAISPSGLSISNSSGQFTQLGNLQSALSPSSIRTSFALQKLLEITRRSGKHFDAQQLAHFGVDVPQGVNGEVTFIGGTSSQLTIGDVIATSAGTAGDATSVLGQVGGKGYNYDDSKPMKFTAPTHGVLMCIYSAEPIVDYKQKGFDYLNHLMERSSWPTPEFDNLGMQPFFMYQTNMSFDPSDTQYSILRWKNRYFPFKQKYNKVVGSLARSLSYWTPQRDYVLNQVSDYYVSPFYLDSIMVKNYEFDADEYWGTNLYDSDPLIHELYFDVQKSSKMSAYGLESL